MVVICPKCKARLKVREAKLLPGAKFKCPKCGAVLMLRRHAVAAKKILDDKKTLGEGIIEEPARSPSVPDERVEKAKRLARTVINDIYIYNSAKLDESVRNNNFYTVFASELKEGKKLYDQRVSQEVRLVADFYKEEIESFISARKKALS